MTSEKDRLYYLIRALMDEIPGFGAVRVPDDIKEGRKLFRALCNVRPPMEASEEFLKIQDEELSFQREEKGVVSLEDIPGGRIRLWQGDITRLGVDAIVNAANSALRGCFHPLHGCIDNAIHSSAGIQLRLECDRIMKAQGMEEPAGKAKITDAYNLPCRKIIHTVGPIVWGTEPSDEDERQLAQCYRSCLSLAEGKGLHSIAFCCISTGEFHFPNERAAEIAVGEVRNFMGSVKNLECVIFNVFKDADYQIYSRILA